MRKTSRTVGLASSFGLVLSFCAFAYAPNAMASEGWWSKLKDMFSDEASEKGETEGVSTSRPGGIDLAEGIRSTLGEGASYAVKNLGRYDGFMADPDVHIPLPEKLEKARSLMAKFGLSAKLDDLEMQINRLAEEATADIGPRLGTAINQLEVTDAREILTGSDDAATRYLQSKAGPDINVDIKKFVTANMPESPAQKSLDLINETLRKLPMGSDMQLDLPGYIADGAEAGIFKYIADKEMDIRKNPARAASDLVKHLFLENK